MPRMSVMLGRCPNHPDSLQREHYGVCDFCMLTTHRHLLPPPDEETKAWCAKLASYANQPRVTYRSEPNCYDQDGVIDDD